MIQRKIYSTTGRKLSRRGFLSTTAAAGAAALVFPIRRVLGANETINVGCIGVGGRGAASAKWFSEIAGVKVAGLCDADAKTLGNVAKQFPGAVKHADQRKILEDKSIDAVVISSPNHWHALAAIWACQAGKDVYVEKPVSLNVWEGRQIVKAARKYNRIVQGGTQQRSDPVQAQIRELIKTEKLGKMLWIRGNRYGMRASVGKLNEPLKPPGDVDYNLWLGPAQDKPMFREKFHYDWHWDWNTGSGEMGNWGVHVLDDIRNMLGDRCTLPTRITAAGGRIAWNDAGETPNVHIVHFETGIVPVIFALSNLPISSKQKADPHYRNIRSGYIIQFENGYYAGARGGGYTHDPAGKRLTAFKGDGGGAHAKNFIEAIRARDKTIQKGEIEQVHYSSSWCHLANVAVQLGAAYDPAQAATAIKDFAPWNEMVGGFHDHIKANDVEVAKAGLKLGASLTFDPVTEQFTGESATPAAQALLRREYRKGFEVLESV